MQIRLRRRSEIHSAWLVRVLARSRRSHACGDCGARMFVRSPSGRCPICAARRRHLAEQVDRIVSEQGAPQVETVPPVA